MSVEKRLYDHLHKVDQDRDLLIVPDFPPHLTWFNSPPLSFNKELKGKIVILDFWTYCCINCMHVLPDLAELEHKYAADPVIFIGVHSPKFDNEKDAGNLRQAILRYEIQHPVVNDPNHLIWNQFDIHSWPTLVMIGPYGNLLVSASGEGHKNHLDAFIQAALNYYHLSLHSSPIALVLEKNQPSLSSALRFPSKIAASNDSLFISDSNHHRILITTLQGKAKEIIGSGKPGFQEGSYIDAQFNRPQGIAYEEKKLYLADAENHALREINLETKIVSTLAGDGTQGHDYKGGLMGRHQKLSTPWDLVMSENKQKLYFAMAGTHQIWVYDFLTKKAYALSGTGAEQNFNHHQLLNAAWAQPSGLTLGNDHLYIADSESSSIRQIDLIHQETFTLVGGDIHPSNLFCFGDRDGKGLQARLQHPLGVLWWPERQLIIVADTYNHRLKLVDPQTKMIQSWIGSGKAGHLDGKGLMTHFAEPSGLAWHPDHTTLFVADTNNHAIRLVNTKTHEVSTLTIDFI